MDLTAAGSRTNIRLPNSLATKKRIAFVFNHSIFQGGGEISFFELIKCLDKKKFVPLVILPESGEIAKRFAGLGLEVSICPFPPLKTIGSGMPLWSLFKFIRILKSANINLIHANGSRACFYSGIAGRLLNIPMIWHVRETIRDLTLYDRFLAHIAAAIIAVSRSVAVKRFGHFSPCISKKIHIAYNGVDTHHFIKNPLARQKIRRQINAGEHTLFGIVGNLIPLKGHDVFLKALAKAKKLQPDLTIKAIFLGRYLDEKYKYRLLRLIVDLNLQNLVIFNGYCDDVARYLSAIDVFALPSQREGCSRSLLEAMSVGLPVIASKISEIEEIVHPAINAVLVEYGDISQMAKAISEMVENKRHSEMPGAENRKLVQEKFSLESHVHCVQRVYGKLLMQKNKEYTYALSH